MAHTVQDLSHYKITGPQGWFPGAIQYTFKASVHDQESVTQTLLYLGLLWSSTHPSFHDIWSKSPPMNVCHLEKMNVMMNNSRPTESSSIRSWQTYWRHDYIPPTLPLFSPIFPQTSPVFQYSSAPPLDISCTTSFIAHIYEWLPDPHFLPRSTLKSQKLPITSYAQCHLRHGQPWAWSYRPSSQQRRALNRPS